MTISHNAGPVVTPLKALWRWLMAAPGQGHVTPDDTQRGDPLGSGCGSAVRSHPPRAQACSPRPAMRAPLRVLRVMEAGQAPAQVGRMRISGRMADVCAELDRLAACESRLH